MGSVPLLTAPAAAAAASPGALAPAAAAAPSPLAAAAAAVDGKAQGDPKKWKLVITNENDENINILQKVDFITPLEEASYLYKIKVI